MELNLGELRWVELEIGWVGLGKKVGESQWTGVRRKVSIQHNLNYASRERRRSDTSKESC